MMKDNTWKKANCPVCGGKELIPVLARKDVPVFQNVVYNNPKEARRAQRGNLIIKRCMACGFAFNSDFNESDISYNHHYENEQGLSETFRRHMNEVAGRIISQLPDQATIVEVGCGQAVFLKELVRLSQGKIKKAIGFDPAYRGAKNDQTIEIFKEYLLPATSKLEALRDIDVVYSRHVIEHVSHITEFLHAISSLFSGRKGMVYIETPSFEWIMDNMVIQDFFYEHCSYFTENSLRYALEKAGMKVLAVDPVFEGQYMLAIAEMGAKPSPVKLPDSVAHSESFASRYALRLSAWNYYLLEDKKKKAIWGAAAKGITFAGIMDPEAEKIACLIDINPEKQGKYTPVTAHPVVSPKAAAAMGIESVIIMNPNYRSEIEKECLEQDITFRFVDEGTI